MGDYSLKRFVRGKLPCPADGLQKTLDTVLAPCCIHRGEPIKHAVILVRHGRAPTGELSAEDRANLFEFAELFAFAALAARRFFWPDYLNRDHLRLVIQAFSDREGGASMQLRRRDGQERLWIPGRLRHGPSPGACELRRPPDAVRRGPAESATGGTGR